MLNMFELLAVFFCTILLIIAGHGHSWLNLHEHEG